MDEARRALCRKIAERLLASPISKSDDITNLKIGVCEEEKVSDVPADAEILSVLSPEERKKLLPSLRRKPVRALSGVSVVAVMTAPFRCPHGTCLYCPGGIGSPFGDTPQSYTGLEPAARRGKQELYDPFKQVAGRIANLETIGHSVSKIELIVMGGTFPSFPEDYQIKFIKGCFDGANGKISSTLSEAMKLNETALHRIVGLTIETRPDWCGEKEVARMLSQGATRVELGVQSLFDDVLKKVARGHTVAQTAEAFRAAREAGLKIVAHMMPFLPGSSSDRELESFRLLFEDERFRPDELKIYPTQVLPGTGLWKMWKEGQYSSPSLDETIDLLTKVKEMTPRFVRIKRILRDIPATVIESGTKKSDIRDIVLRKMAAEGKRCQCVRCREIGRNVYSGKLKPDLQSIRMSSFSYRASGAEEVFLTFDELRNDLLVGLLRLRLSERAMVRELHIYGWSVPVGKSGDNIQSYQHRGYGTKLLAEAEKIAKEKGYRELLVLSGVGAREYYRKFGYELQGPYMVKRLE
jgi:elongator complex protein 3